MDHDGEIAALLPDPPPPRPARREAAIDEAMRRFDAIGEPLRATGRRPAASPAKWTARFMRPQFGALVATVLLVVVAVPVWLSRDHTSLPPTKTIAASAVDGAPSPVPATGPAASPALVGSGMPTLEAQRKPEPALASSSPASMEEGRQADQPAPPPQAPAQMADSNTALAPAPEAARKEKSSSARSDGNAQLAEAGAPPPAVAIGAAKSTSAPANADAAKARGLPSDQLVVTARRIDPTSAHEAASPRKQRAANQPPQRGDWNACTVNDPAHSLETCGKLVDPAASGPAGRAAAHVAEGLSRAWVGNLDGAISAFDQAIARSPRFAFAYLNRGLAYERKGDFANAMADLDRAVRHAPGDARNYYNRSLLLRRQGDDIRAAADADHAIELDARYRAVIR